MNLDAFLRANAPEAPDAPADAERRLLRRIATRSLLRRVTPPLAAAATLLAAFLWFHPTAPNGGRSEALTIVKTAYESVDEETDELPGEEYLLLAEAAGARS
jgi:hypothetical protein